MRLVRVNRCSRWPTCLAAWTLRFGSELENGGGKISALRRNLQREHLKQLVRLTVRSVPGVPEDATSLARASLGCDKRKNGERAER